jgi:hypothetical protein
MISILIRRVRRPPCGLRAARAAFHQPQRAGKGRVDFLNGFAGWQKNCRPGTCCEFTSAQILEYPRREERIVT